MTTTKKTTKPYVIVRGSIATFCGYLDSAKGQEVTLSEARMIGYWEKRHMLSTLAKRGPEAGHSRLSDAVDRTVILDATAIISCSAEAAKGLREIKTYEVK